MGADLVVGGGEGVEVALEGGDAARGVLLEVALRGPMPAFGLS